VVSGADNVIVVTFAGSGFADASIAAKLAALLNVNPDRIHVVLAVDPTSNTQATITIDDAPTGGSSGAAVAGSLFTKLRSNPKALGTGYEATKLVAPGAMVAPPSAAPSSSTTGKDAKGLTSGGKAGIAIAAVVLGLVAVAAIAFTVTHRRRSMAKVASDAGHEMSGGEKSDPLEEDLS